MRTNRMAGIVISAVAGGTLVLGAAAPALAAGTDHHDGPRTAAAAPEVDTESLELLAHVGQLTEATAQNVSVVQRATENGGKVDKGKLVDVAAHIKAVDTAAKAKAKAKGKVKSAKAEEAVVLATAVATLETELTALVSAGVAGDAAAVEVKAELSITALVKVLAAVGVSGLVPAAELPAVPSTESLPDTPTGKLPTQDATQQLPTGGLTQQLPGGLG